MYNCFANFVLLEQTQALRFEHNHYQHVGNFRQLFINIFATRTERHFQERVINMFYDFYRKYSITNFTNAHTCETIVEVKHSCKIDIYMKESA